MRLVYTGRKVEFPPNQAKKLDSKLERISKLLGRNDKEARVILTQERFLHQAEITVNAWDHGLVAVGTDGDLFTAMNSAVEKLEKQVAKLRTKWRVTKRHKTAPQRTPEGAERTAAMETKAAPVPAPKPKPKSAKTAAAVAAKASGPRIYRVGQDAELDHRLKPMTVDEALLEIDAKEDYFIFRDAKTDRLGVLLRRGDGNFNLIET